MSTAVRDFTAIPGPPQRFFTGNLRDIDPSRFPVRIEQWADEFGPIYRFRILNTRLVAVSDPAAITHLFRERPHVFRRASILENRSRDFDLVGVFTAEGENWRRQRRIVASALNTAHLRQFFPSLLKTTSRLRDRWLGAAADGRIVDVHAELMRYTVDVIGELAFGMDFNTLETDGPVIQQDLDVVMKGYNRRLFSLLPYWRVLKLPRDRALEHGVRRVRSNVESMIAETRARMANDPSLFESPRNFLEAIIAAREAERVEFTDDDIVANVFTLLLAGEDTTATTIAWAMATLLRHPDAFRALRREADETIGDAAMFTQIEQTTNVPRLDRCVLESMRLRPVAPITGMEPLEDVELLGYRIPKGVSVLLLLRHAGLNEAHFGDAAAFRPERWADDGAGAIRPHHPDAHIPFGSGPRFCPGRNLALLEIRTVLTMLCRNFDIALADPEQRVTPSYEFLTVPRGLLLRFRKRQDGPGPREGRGS